METTGDKQPLPCPDHKDYDLNLPSSLTQFGIDAMRWWESLPKAGIHMRKFRVLRRQLRHLETPLPEDTCFACCGGAARCAVEGWTPENFRVSDVGPGLKVKWAHVNELESILNCIRLGNVDTVFYGWDLDPSKGREFNRDITNYHESPELFYRDMQQLSDDLKAGGY